MNVTKLLAIVLASASLSVSACKPSDNVPPPAPAMPANWTVKGDQTFNHNEREFLELEGRLQDRLKALRVTVYEVDGQSVRLNTIVPLTPSEADKMYRILANKKPPWSYIRKASAIYEFAGTGDSEKAISDARDMLAQQPDGTN